MLSNVSSHNVTCKTTYDCLHLYACRLANTFSYMYNVHDINKTTHLLKNPGKIADHQEKFMYILNCRYHFIHLANFTILATF